MEGTRGWNKLEAQLSAQQRYGSKNKQVREGMNNALQRLSLDDINFLVFEKKTRKNGVLLYLLASCSGE